MLFLLRFAFWILVICLLLAGPREDNRRLLSPVEQTVNDVRGFCGRNPEVCEDARAAMTSVLVKLKNGAELIQAWLTAASSEQTGPAGRPANGAGQAVRAVPRWQDSLKPPDKQMPWRGPPLL